MDNVHNTIVEHRWYAHSIPLCMTNQFGAKGAGVYAKPAGKPLSYRTHGSR